MASFLKTSLYLTNLSNKKNTNYWKIFQQIMYHFKAHEMSKVEKLQNSTSQFSDLKPTSLWQIILSTWSIKSSNDFPIKRCIVGKPLKAQCTEGDGWISSALTWIYIYLLIQTYSHHSTVIYQSSSSDLYIIYNICCLLTKRIWERHLLIIADSGKLSKLWCLM